MMQGLDHAQILPFFPPYIPHPLPPEATCPAPHCRFQGVYDIRRAVDAAQGQRILHSMVLGAVATTLAAAARLQARLQQDLDEPQQGDGAHAFAELQQLAAGIGDALPQLRQAIEQCIQVRAAVRHACYATKRICSCLDGGLLC